MTIDRAQRKLSGRYEALIGTGGIGSGAFFALDGDHTLGREESRSGRLLDRRDYCKLHIVAHYVKVLCAPDFVVLPIGRVGADEAGDRLLDEMRAAGLDLRYVERAAGERTLYALCFVYPDGSGGNLTTNDSACARVDAGFVAGATADFVRFAGRGVALALPEVPLDARLALLELGRQHGFLRVASFTSAEMRAALAAGLLDQVDLLAANLDEAAAALGLTAKGTDAEGARAKGAEAGGPEAGDAQAAEAQAMGSETKRVVRAAVDVLGRRGRMLSITAGAHGSWSWDGKTLLHRPALRVEVAGTAGAGDAHLAGMIAGLAAGLSLGQAHELAALAAAFSVTSPHSINQDLTPQTLRLFARRCGVEVSAGVSEVLAR